MPRRCDTLHLEPPYTVYRKAVKARTEAHLWLDEYICRAAFEEGEVLWKASCPPTEAEPLVAMLVTDRSLGGALALKPRVFHPQGKSPGIYVHSRYMKVDHTYEVRVAKGSVIISHVGSPEDERSAREKAKRGRKKEAKT